jgi:hypothetical protein
MQSGDCIVRRTEDSFPTALRTIVDTAVQPAIGSCLRTASLSLAWVFSTVRSVAAGGGELPPPGQQAKWDGRRP